MKKLMVSFVMFIIGFIGGIYAFLKWIVKSDRLLPAFKKGLVDDFEYILLGYNTVKTYSKRHRWDYQYYPRYDSHRKYFKDYYHSNDFKKDEEEER